MNDIFLYGYIAANAIYLTINIPRMLIAIKNKHLGIGNKHLASEFVQLLARIPMFAYQVHIGATAIYIACLIDILFNTALFVINVQALNQHKKTQTVQSDNLTPLY